MDYPDPDEEFEMMYADELEMMNEIDAENNGNLITNSSNYRMYTFK